MNLSPQQILASIEHTLLRPEATVGDIDRLCQEAVEFHLGAVCINPVHVKRAADQLRKMHAGPDAGTPPRIVSVAGFPLGASHSTVKADEARRGMADGAQEIDMVVALGALADGDRAYVRRDIEAVACAVHQASPAGLLKVILETGALSETQITLGCRCCAEGKADFVKTSTGLHPSGGATVEHVQLLHRLAAPIQVKAAGGIRTLAQVKAMLSAGATRIGTSAGVSIARELMQTQP